jgi:SAM-dependent methyltransferase
MADTIRPYVGRQVLEIGAGIGNLTRLLVAGRMRYVASDVDPEHLARLGTRFHHRPRLEIRNCDLSSADDFFGLAGAMETVVCLNVLEHIEDDMASLRNIHSALRAGGTAVILVPCDQRIFGSLDTALGHVRRYSREELRGKMELAGFRIECILDFNRISRPGWYIAGKLLKRTNLNPWMLRLFDRLVWLWRVLDARLPWEPASLIAVGVRR